MGSEDLNSDGLVERLRSLADCDARSGEPLGKCMREAADEIERLRRIVYPPDPPMPEWVNIENAARYREGRALHPGPIPPSAYRGNPYADD